MTTETEDYYICPACGAEVRVGSSGCRKCSPPRERKSWEQDEAHDGLDLPDSDEEFDYESFVADEFAGPRKRSAKEIVFMVAGIILLIALFFAWVVL